MQSIITELAQTAASTNIILTMKSLVPTVFGNERKETNVYLRHDELSRGVTNFSNFPHLFARG
jgi:hypothetical protein